MTALLESLDRARIDFDFSALADLWRTGYEPTAEEFEALATFALDRKRRVTRQGVVAKARAVLRYKELRANKWSVADAKAKVADEFSMHEVMLEDPIRGKNSAVNQILAKWAARGAA